MSHTSVIKRTSITDLQAMKGVSKIVSLTAYSTPMAQLLDTHIDLFIVGDSVGMVLYGLPSTLPVTLEVMCLHGKAVVEHSNRACVLVDMPFGSYQESKELAFRHAARIMEETGCQCVKLEGGLEMRETVEFITSRGIPVMAHLGLKPQHVNSMGGYKYQGRSEDDAAAMLNEASAMQDAGAFALLLEGTKESVARHITQSVSIPTIGIGASPACDGQVLVTEDMLGLHETTPSFVRTYGNLRDTISQAVENYAQDVRKGHFPHLDECFGVIKK